MVNTVEHYKTAAKYVINLLTNISGGSGKKKKKINKARANVRLFLIKGWMGNEETGYGWFKKLPVKRN